MRIKRLSKEGFTLVELMIVVAIVGVLAALAIYGVRKYVLNAKTAEARNSIGQMAKDASTAYQREGMSADRLPLGDSTGIVHRLCASASATVPDALAKVSGQKYQSAPEEWAPAADDQWTGFKCLKFSMQEPQYFMYNYTASGTTGAAGETFAAGASGDLDNDSDPSSFTLTGEITAGTSGELVLVTAPNILENDPEE